MTREDVPIVLLVSDNQDHILTLSGILEEAGYRVRAAGDGEEALSLLTQQPFDLIITDIRMPRMGGLDLLRNIRTMNPKLAVVVVTAHGEWTTYINAMNIGAVDYLTKPVRGEDILITIRRALTRRGIRAPDVPPTGSEES